MVTKMVTKCQIKLCHSLALHSWCDVGIDVHCDCDSGVAQPFLNHLRMNATRQQLRRMTVAEVVEAHSGKPTYAPNQICELMGEAGRLFGLAINPSTNQAVATLSNPNRQ